MSSSILFAGIPDSILIQLEEYYDLPQAERFDAVLGHMAKMRPTHELMYNVIQKELDYARRIDSDPLTLVKILTQLSHNEINFGQFDAATQKIVEGKKLITAYADDSRDWQIQVGRSYYYMSRIYFYNYKTQEAVDEVLKGIPYLETAKDTGNMVKVYAHMGECLAELNEPKEAMKYHNKVTEIAKSYPYNSSFSHSYLGKINCLIALDKYTEAKEFLSSFIEQSISYRADNAYMLRGKLAQIETYLGNYNEANRIFEPILNDIHNKDSISSIFQKMAIVGNYVELQKRAGNYNKASIYQDTLLNFTHQELQLLNKNQIAEAEVKFKKLEDEKRIQELELEQTIAQSKKRSMYLGFGGLLLALLGGFYFWNYRNKQKQNQILLLAAKEKETQAVREKLLTSITHELRTPLAIISGKLESLAQENLEVDQQKTLLTAQRNTAQLVQQINQLLEWNKLEAKALQNNPSIGNAEQVLETIIEDLKPISEHKNISWNMGVTNQEYLGKLDFSKFKTILNNLISNAIKYAPIGSNLNIKLFLEKSNLICSVQDEGPGIPAQQLPHIFDWYYRVANNGNKNNYEGFGIGLALSKELAELMNGQLTVESKQGSGTIFSLNVPFQKIVAQEVATAAQEQQSAANPAGPKPPSDELTLLVVEDHPDLAEHIAFIFKKEFKVLIAHDLENAKFLAETEVPDMIISDIMLPDGNGLDFCQHVKAQMITSHIPIILLTARIDEATRFKGIENRADAFMTKPFNNHELKLRVHNLLQNRRILKLRFGNGQQSFSNETDTFTNMVLKVLEDNYSDSTFGVDDFARSLNISRGQAYKKFRTTLDKTPTNLLKEFRLEKARNLLTSGELTIAEIAYQCGFNSPEYFSTVFKEHFKQSPSNFKS